LAPDFHTFRANSAFDPDETATGHSLKGFDIQAGIYNDYTVLGCAYKITFITNGSTKKLCGALVTTNSALGSNFDTQSEVMETTGKYNRKILLQGSGDSDEEVKSIKGYIPMSKFMFTTGGSFSEQFTSGVTQNPSTPVRIHVWGMNEDGTALAADNLIARVMLKYYVIYSGVVAATAS